MKIRYQFARFRTDSLARIETINAVIADFMAAGYTLTLRQLYYQLVAHHGLPNKDREYNKLGVLVSKARRAGLIDWEAIVDRTRFLRSLPTWTNPADIVGATAQQFRVDMWATQRQYVEVWFEKDALLGVFERAANPLRIPYFSCRGYASDSVLWEAAQRLQRITGPTDGETVMRRTPQKPVTILHFGDHDPSGMDMTRDIEERLALFGADARVIRVALNMDQVEQYVLPPNPAKLTDSRYEAYAAEHGQSSWELDALDPKVVGKMLEDEVKDRVDLKAWKKAVAVEEQGRKELQSITRRYADVIKFLNKPPRKPRKKKSA